MRLLVLAIAGGEMRLMSPGKGGDDKDNPLHFSGEIKDRPTFKEAIQSRAATPRGSSRRHYASDTTDLATDLQLSLNKNRLASMGSNFCDHTKLGFKDAAALEKAHKAVDLKYF
jgi:hypothetical protein